MKRLIITFTLGALFLVPPPLRAWKFRTHRYSVINAFEYMEGPRGTAMQKWAARFIKYSGGSEIHLRIADKNGNTDEFGDTKIGGWWSGTDTSISLPGFLMNFTCFWHFIDMSRPGSFGNAYDGFSARRTLAGGYLNYNYLLRSMLHNREIRNHGPAGCLISLPVDGAGPIEAYRFRYRESSVRRYASTTPSSNYDNFQDAVFEPCSNASAYWYGQALEGTAPGVTDMQHLDYLGHAMHMANDATVTHHVWNTLDHYHESYETWVNENVGTLYNADRVRELITEFLQVHGVRTDQGLRNVLIQEIIIYYAGLSLNMPAPLYSESLAVRANCGAAQYNASVAQNILILTKYVMDLYAESERRRY